MTCERKRFKDISRQSCCWSGWDLYGGSVLRVILMFLMLQIKLNCLLKGSREEFKAKRMTIAFICVVKGRWQFILF
ncbi:hypothetical protein P8452_48901 [Trifolium repens]|nr:hypothetical protein P8452_48901 [Trifolium repens]